MILILTIIILLLTIEWDLAVVRILSIFHIYNLIYIITNFQSENLPIIFLDLDWWPLF